MRLTVHIRCILGLVAVLNVTNGLCQDAERARIDRLARSVVKVIVQGGSGTGFAFGDNQIVTALHVVIGQTDVQVHSPRSGRNSRCTLIASLARYDLALLQLERDMNLQALQLGQGDPRTGDELLVIGYSVDSPSALDKPISFRGRRTIRDIGPRSMRDELENAGMPDLNAEMFFLVGSLAPGDSGAPIFNNNGQVVAIGDGGIENGVRNLNWGIPSSYINELLSASPVLPARVNIPRVQSLFRSETDMEIEGDDAVELTLPLRYRGQRISFVKQRTRTLGEIRRTATTDDLNGLNNLIGRTRVPNPDNLELDIYSHGQSGATFVVPAGAELRVDRRGDIVGSAANGDVPLRIHLAEAANPNEAQQEMLNFQGSFGRRDIYWVVDFNSSYAIPSLTSNGIRALRQFLVGFAVPEGFPPQFVAQAATNGQLMLSELAFTGQVYYNGLFLCSVAFNRNVQEQARQAMPEWAAAVFGVHLTSFSN